MGHPKWSLERQGRRWVDLAAEALRPLCERVILSVSEVSGWPEGHERLHDLWPSRGPLSAWAGFSAVFPVRDLLSVPVDMSLVESRDLAPLVEAGSAHLISALGPHYLAAFVLAGDLQRLAVASGGKPGSVKGFWERTPHVTRPLESSRAIDANTPGSCNAGL